ncbi:hypothetical protein L1887_18073 [Cichorium endivia]|nr:hypothetical protein L1887_18073 [Cichorium endivia]
MQSSYPSDKEHTTRPPHWVLSNVMYVTAHSSYQGGLPEPGSPVLSFVVSTTGPELPEDMQRAVIGTLTRLCNETSEALGGSRAVPAKKQEINDNSKKLALNSGDFPTALKIQVGLITVTGTSAASG